MLAAEAGHVDVVTHLLACQADMRQSNKFGECPLHRASQNGHVHVVEALLRGGAAVNAQTAERETPLLIAAGRGDLVVALALIRHGADIGLFDLGGRTALHWAVIESRFGVIDVLLAQGASPNFKDEEGWTSLHHACQQGSVSNVLTLLRHGADVELLATDGMTPILVGAKFGHLVVVQELIRAFRAQQPAHDVEENLRLHINLVDTHGSSALLVAAINGNIGTVSELLNAGANINHEAFWAGTALWNAVFKGNLDLVKVLLMRGAEVNFVCVQTDGLRALDLAVSCGYLDVVTCLLLAGADVRESQPGKPTPRTFALEAGYDDIADTLREVELANTHAREGRVSFFIAAITAGKLTAPSEQWVRLLPDPACAELSTWVHGCLTDSRACFAAFYHCRVEDRDEEVDEAYSIRRYTETEGPVSELIGEYLVHTLASTRRILRELPRVITDRARRIENGLPVYPP